MVKKVFINRLLNLRKIRYIGLDMDHTLIRYHTEAFERLVFKMAIERLIKDNGYPAKIRQFKFDYQRAMRGLVIDKINGNIIKLSRFAAIRLSYHGSRRIPYDEQKKIYHSVYVDLNDDNYVPVDTSFSIAHSLLFQLLVDLKDQNIHELPEYPKINDDIRVAVDVIHADGSLKKQVAKDLSRFIIQEPALVEGLKSFISYGKKFFILTNSDFHYTKLLLDYAINPFLEKGESWLSLFQHIIVLADKPRFFFDNQKFLRIDPDTGLMQNTYTIQRSGVYQGGNATDFTKQLRLLGDNILYIGDHIYGDIVRLKKDCNWRTAMVIESLDKEVAAFTRTQSVQDAIHTVMCDKYVLEDELMSYNREIEENKKVIANLLRRIGKYDSKLSTLIAELESAFNPYWGQMFRTGAEESYFASQVERFACIYMEKLSDLLTLSPQSYFRAHRRVLPHEQNNML